MCVIAYSKQYREKVFADDVLRERKNLKQRIYTKKESAKEVRKRYYEENKDKINAQRLLNFRQNPDKVLKRREQQRNMSEFQRERRRQRQNKRYSTLTKEQKNRWRINNKTHVLSYTRMYRSEVQIHKERANRKELADSYVVNVIKARSNYKVKTADIPKEVIETKKNVIAIRRILNNK